MEQSLQKGAVGFYINRYHRLHRHGGGLLLHTCSVNRAHGKQPCQPSQSHDSVDCLEELKGNPIM